MTDPTGPKARGRAQAPYGDAEWSGQASLLPVNDPADWAWPTDPAPRGRRDDYRYDAGAEAGYYESGHGPSLDSGPGHGAGHAAGYDPWYTGDSRNGAAGHPGDPELGPGGRSGAAMMGGPVAGSGNRDPRRRPVRPAQRGSGDDGSEYQGSGYQGSGYLGSGYEGSGYQGSGYQGSGYLGSGYEGSGDQGAGYDDPGHGGSGYAGTGYGDLGRPGGGRAFVPDDHVVSGAPHLDEPVEPPTPDRRRGRGAVRTRQPRSPLRAAFGAVAEVVVVVAMALSLALIIKTFLVQAFFIPSGSMENTLIIGDRVLVSKLTPGAFDLHRGDVIVFKDPGGWLEVPVPVDEGPLRNGVRSALTFVGLLPQDSGEHLIKRVIGVAGDKVACCDAQHRITVNGVGIDEPYLYPGNSPSEQPFSVTVTPGHLWVMGDHRSVSADSRQQGHGLVPIDSVVGKAFVIVWPLGRATTLSVPDSVFARLPDPPATT